MSRVDGLGLNTGRTRWTSPAAGVAGVGTTAVVLDSLHGQVGLVAQVLRAGNEEGRRYPTLADMVVRRVPAPIGVSVPARHAWCAAA